MVTYIGPVLDSSGYGNAARNNVAALHSIGTKIEVMPITFEKQKANIGELGLLMSQLTNRDADNAIHIVHCTPQNYPHLVKEDKYNIGYAAWESSLLPDGWADHINLLNEIWCPSEYNVQVFKDSGVTIPVYCVPHTFDMDRSVEPDMNLVGKRKPDEFMFYSIFQWLERKNPLGLLVAYLTEFEPGENVSLALKTFLQSHNSPQEVAQIRSQIKEVKNKLHMSSFPRVLLISQLLSAQEIAGLHAIGDCFVLPHRCEGFGIPIAEATLAGNPTISTNYGGAVDFITHEETGYLTNYTISPVYGMPWHIYSGKMNWADPDLSDVKKWMRYVFENRDEAKKVALTGKTMLEDNLSWESVGNRMKERLDKIKAELT